MFKNVDIAEVFYIRNFTHGGWYDKSNTKRKDLIQWIRASLLFFVMCFGRVLKGERYVKSQGGLLTRCQNGGIMCAKDILTWCQNRA